MLKTKKWFSRRYMTATWYKSHGVSGPINLKKIIILAQGAHASNLSCRANKKRAKESKKRIYFRPQKKNKNKNIKRAENIKLIKKISTLTSLVKKKELYLIAKNKKKYIWNVSNGVKVFKIFFLHVSCCLVTEMWIIVKHATTFSELAKWLLFIKTD